MTFGTCGVEYPAADEERDSGFETSITIGFADIVVNCGKQRDV